jgi:hypothetical protein
LRAEPCDASELAEGALIEDDEEGDEPGSAGEGGWPPAA